MGDLQESITHLSDAVFDISARVEVHQECLEIIRDLLEKLIEVEKNHE